jgi:acetyl esterase/lipase
LTLDLHRLSSRGQVPVVLELHGGGWRGGSRGVFTPLVSEARSFGRIVDGGFAVVAADYRLSGEAPFPAQVDDVLAALDWTVAHADEFDIDASRIVLWGGSAGGTLAALAAIRWSGTLRGVIDWYGPSDLLGMPRLAEPTREDLWLGAPVPSVPETAISASPARQVRAGLPPFHLAHGADDTDVPPAQSELLAAALRVAGGDVELHLEPGAGHFWRGASDAATDALFDRAIDFARRVAA